MFTNVGVNIKKYVKLLFGISAFLTLVITIFLMYIIIEAGGDGLALVVLLVGGLVIVVEWIGTWIVYGYGELVDRVIRIEQYQNPNKSAKHIPNPAPSPATAPAPAPNPEDRYSTLLSLRTQGLISQEEFDEAVSKFDV